DRVDGIGHRIEPALLQARLDQLFQHGVTQVVLAFKVVKERALRCAGSAYDVIQTAALESVLVELVESRPEYLPACVFRRLAGNHRHYNNRIIQTGRYVVNRILRSFCTLPGNKLLLEQRVASYVSA